MSTYACPRCGFDTPDIFLYKKHIYKLTICEPKIADISLDDVKKEYTPNIYLCCDYCIRKFKTDQLADEHKKVCILNPKQKQISDDLFAKKQKQIYDNLLNSAELGDISNVIDSPLHIIVKVAGLYEDTEFNIRKTDEKSTRISLIDLVVVNTLHSPKIASNILSDLINLYKLELSGKIEYFQFPGQDQFPTPVTNVENAIMIIQLLSKYKYTAFNMKNFKVIARFLFEPSLYHKIETSEISAPKVNNDKNVRSITETTTKEKAFVRLNNLIIHSNMDIINVGIPDALRPPSSVYVNHVGFDPELNKDVFKYGKTDNFVQRQKEHKAKYPYSTTVLVVSLGTHSPACAEDTIRYLGKVLQRIVIVEMENGSMTQETFACNKEDVSSVLKSIRDEITRIHVGKVRSVHYGSIVTDAMGKEIDPLSLKPVQLTIETNSSLMDVKQPPENPLSALEMERERTKQMEASYINFLTLKINVKINVKN